MIQEAAVVNANRCKICRKIITLVNDMKANITMWTVLIIFTHDFRSTLGEPDGYVMFRIFYGINQFRKLYGGMR